MMILLVALGRIILIYIIVIEAVYVIVNYLKSY